MTATLDTVATKQESPEESAELAAARELVRRAKELRARTELGTEIRRRGGRGPPRCVDRADLGCVPTIRYHDVLQVASAACPAVGEGILEARWWLPIED